MLAAQTIAGFDADVQRGLELVGTFVFGASGGLMAVRKHYDVVGVVALALATALGGGVVRDVLIGAAPPAALDDTWVLGVALAAAAFAFVAHGVIEHRLRRAWLVFDAAGLGLFCVTGTVKALTFGVSGLAAALLGVVTAVGGGVLRDVLARDEPSLFQRDTALYAIPAAFGAAVVLSFWRVDQYGGAVGGGVAVSVFVARVAALRYGVRAPTPRPARQPPRPTSGRGVGRLRRRP